MRLAEIAPLVVLQTGEVTPHARQAWNDRAYVAAPIGFGVMYLFETRKGGTCGPYGVNFDDLMADDWTVVAVDGVGDA